MGDGELAEAVYPGDMEVAETKENVSGYKVLSPRRKFKRATSGLQDAPDCHRWTAVPQ